MSINFVVIIYLILNIMHESSIPQSLAIFVATPRIVRRGAVDRGRGRRDAYFFVLDFRRMAAPPPTWQLSLSLSHDPMDGPMARAIAYRRRTRGRLRGISTNDFVQRLWDENDMILLRRSRRMSSFEV